jgi:hypothetical protein
MQQATTEFPYYHQSIVSDSEEEADELTLFSELKPMTLEADCHYRVPSSLIPVLPFQLISSLALEVKWKAGGSVETLTKKPMAKTDLKAGSGSDPLSLTQTE